MKEYMSWVLTRKMRYLHSLSGIRYFAVVGVLNVFNISSFIPGVIGYTAPRWKCPRRETGWLCDIRTKISYLIPLSTFSKGNSSEYPLAICFLPVAGVFKGWLAFFLSLGLHIHVVSQKVQKLQNFPSGDPCGAIQHCWWTQISWDYNVQTPRSCSGICKQTKTSFFSFFVLSDFISCMEFRPYMQTLMYMSKCLNCERKYH